MSCTTTVSDINMAAFALPNANIKVGTVMPSNSTAKNVTGVTQTNSALPTPAIVPAAAVSASNSKITKQTTAIQTAKPVTLKQLASYVVSVASTVAEFSRAGFALAMSSPLAAATSIRNLVCKGIDIVKTFDISKLLDINFPKMPQSYKNFSFKKFITGLIAKAEAAIIKFIRSLIPKIPTWEEIKAYIRAKINELKDLFTCNPGDKH